VLALDLSNSRYEPVAGSFEQGSESSDFVKDSEFLTSTATISFSGNTLQRGVRIEAVL
jgi:hypothetical protein